MKIDRRLAHLPFLFALSALPACKCGSDAPAPAPVAASAPAPAVPTVLPLPLGDAGVVDAGPTPQPLHGTLDGDRCLELRSGRLACWREGPKEAAPAPHLPSEIARAGRDGGVSRDEALARLAARPEGEILDLEIGDGAIPYCALLRSGEIDCGPAPARAQNLRRVAQPFAISMARQPLASRDALAGCAVGADGSAQCWFENARPRPLPVKGAVAVAVSRTDVCVRLGTGRAECWAMTSGRTTRKGLRRPKGMPPVLELVAVTQGFCGRARDGRVFCFGDSSRMDAYEAKPVQGVRGTTALVSRGEVACASRENEPPACWHLGVWERVRPELFAGVAELAPIPRKDAPPSPRAAPSKLATKGAPSALATRAATTPSPPRLPRLALGPGRLCTLTDGVLQCANLDPGAPPLDEEASREDLQRLPQPESRALGGTCPELHFPAHALGWTKDSRYYLFTSTPSCRACDDGPECDRPPPQTVAVDAETGARTRYRGRETRDLRRERGRRSRAPRDDDGDESRDPRNSRNSRKALTTGNSGIPGGGATPAVYLGPAEHKAFLREHPRARRRAPKTALKTTLGVRYARVELELGGRKLVWRWRSERSSCGAPVVRDRRESPDGRRLALLLEWPGYRCAQHKDAPGSESWLLLVDLAPRPDGGIPGGVAVPGASPIPLPAAAPLAPTPARAFDAPPAVAPAALPSPKTARPPSPAPSRRAEPPAAPREAPREIAPGVVETGPKDE